MVFFMVTMMDRQTDNRLIDLRRQTDDKLIDDRQTETDKSTPCTCVHVTTVYQNLP